MNTVLDSHGQLTLPKTIRTQRQLKAGERFEVTLDADDPDLILLRRQRKEANRGLVDHLLACPVKDFVRPPKRRGEPMRRVPL